jgi:hypothetical protein
MLNWTDDQLEDVGLDKAKVESIARRFRRLSREMWEMELYVYGASGSGHLMHRSRPPHIDQPGGDLRADQDAPIADLGEGFDGGDW